MTALIEPHPGPLDLNCNEGKWLAALKGPIPGGWFSFGLHGNPPMGIPVELAKGSGHAKPDLSQGILLGYRTEELVPHQDPVRPEAKTPLTERWIIAGTIRAPAPPRFRPVPGYSPEADRMLAYWRPRTDRTGKYRARPPRSSPLLLDLLIFLSASIIALDTLGRWFGVIR